MAFVPWKDRVTETPHRYKLTEVSADTYDLEAVPGTIGEAGTPVNAANLNKLIQRDGDDIKDTVTTFTEASTRANIATGESTATLFGKIKKWYTDLKPHAFTTPSATQSTSADTVPSSKLLRESTFARVYREATEISGITYPVSITDLLNKIIADNLLNCVFVIGMNAATETKVTGLPTIGEAPQTFGTLTIITPSTSALRMRVEYSKEIGTDSALMWVGSLVRSGNTVTSVVWKQIIDDSTAQTISGVKTFTASPLVPTTPSGPSSAVNKAYADGLSTPYDKVIRTQAEFNELIASPTWLGATSVALVGQFTYSEANNSGIKVPATVKQIHGFNSAKITITNFVYNSSTAKGGLWYDTLPTIKDYSIRDLEVDCTGTDGSGRGFYNCTNLTNCTGTGTGTYGYGFFNCTNLTNCTGTGTGTSYGYGCGFYNCTNLTNCTGTGTGTGTGNGYGFYNCTNLTNCTGTGTGTYGYGFSDCTNLANCTGTGTGTGTGNGYGFYNCTNLTNCTGTGTGIGAAIGFGFYYITYASNCKDGGSSTAMWGGPNKNIDLDTCRKTPVAADNTELNA